MLLRGLGFGVESSGFREIISTNGKSSGKEMENEMDGGLHALNTKP